MNLVLPSVGVLANYNNIPVETRRAASLHFFYTVARLYIFLCRAASLHLGIYAAFLDLSYDRQGSVVVHHLHLSFVIERIVVNAIR